MSSKITRPLTNTLRVMIAGGSVAAFVGGWALLAHAPIASEASTLPSDDSVLPGSNAPAQQAPQNNNVPPLQVLPTPRARNAPQRVQPNTTQPFGGSNQPVLRQRRMRSGGS